MSQQPNVMYGQRGHILLEMGGYKYKKHRPMATGEMRWRCCKNSCAASLKTVEPNHAITEINLIHNHEPLSERDRQRQVLSGVAKQKAEEQISERPAKLLRSLLTEQNTQTLQTSDLSKIKRNMYDARRKTLPTLPTSREEVQEAIRSLDLKTINEEEFVLVNDRDNELVVFSCLANLKALENASAPQYF